MHKFLYKKSIVTGDNVSQILLLTNCPINLWKVIRKNSYEKFEFLGKVFFHNKRNLFERINRIVRVENLSLLLEEKNSFLLFQNEKEALRINQKFEEIEVYRLKNLI